jgi:hypothetical protein
MRLAIAILLPFVAWGQVSLQTASSRLAAEARQFFETASKLSGREVLENLSPLAAGAAPSSPAAAAAGAAETQWRRMTVESEYGFGILEGGDMVELRRVVAVDGKPVKSKVESLAAAVFASGDRRKRELLRVFERVGVAGAATDFGQILLLFHPNSIPAFELQIAGSSTLGESPAVVLRYRQMDGPPKMTIHSGEDDTPLRVPAQGLIWLDRQSLTPLRITLQAIAGDDAEAVRVEAQVDYRRSGFGIVLPAKVSHRELRGGKVLVSNDFTYSDFRYLEKPGGR